MFPVALVLGAASTLDNTPAGTVLATAGVIMSQDGAPFSGTIR